VEHLAAAPRSLERMEPNAITGRPLQRITVHLVKPRKQKTVRYEGVLLLQEPGHLLVHARWERAAMDLGYVVFAPGDHFFEHYYTERWYNIFEVRSAADDLKGWYCNITRPALLVGDVVTSEDLELDLFVAPDRRQVLKLDQDEFDALKLDVSEPAAYAAALQALAELEEMARAGAPPFDSRDTYASTGAVVRIDSCGEGEMCQ
jgi:predicted RNA-binding protein associated with RNAse of E/G family